MSKRLEVIFLTSAKRDLKKLDGQARDRIFSWVYETLLNADSPRDYGEALHGNLKGLWKYRVGEYRLIAEIVDDRILVKFLTIGHRSDVYKKIRNQL
jgi:mRNA interferase RelE/StbE